MTHKKDMKTIFSIFPIIMLLLFLGGNANAERGIAIRKKSLNYRTALIIGNSNYKNAALKNPTNDAKDMAEILKKSGFNVTLVINASQRKMENAIRGFGRKLRKGGTALFYYAGHGIQVNGRNYLIPIGSTIDSESDVKYEAVDAGLVLGKMEDAGNDLNIVILDACRNNPFARSFRSSAKGLAQIDAPKGSIVAYATAPGAVAADGNGENGLYTKYLIQFIQMGGLSIEQVFKRVRIAVVNESGNKQVPWESSSLMGEFYFCPKSNKINANASTGSIVNSSEYNFLQNGQSWEEPATKIRFVWVDGGCFTMGKTQQYKEIEVKGLQQVHGDNWKHYWDMWDGDDGYYRHEVCVDGFWIGETEVTINQWRSVIKKIPNQNNRKMSNGKLPVYVTWYEAKDYLKNLSKLYNDQYNFRLPTEAEWEYACRSGGRDELYSGGNNVSNYAWHGDNSGHENHQVRKKPPNGLGLFDMSGNVSEWVEDTYRKFSYTKHEYQNPLYIDTKTDQEKVYKGGSSGSMPYGCSCLGRGSISPSHKYNGFRVIISTSPN